MLCLAVRQPDASDHGAYILANIVALFDEKLYDLVTEWDKGSS